MEFQKCDVNEKKKEKKERKNKQRITKQGRENYKETTGTKLITNTKKQKLKILSRVWNSENTMLKKEEEKEREKKKNKQEQTKSHKL